jgi:hypothetical protein
LLIGVGHRLGYRAWISRGELHHRQHGAALLDLLTVAERYMNVEDILPDANEHSQLIDCIWYRGRQASHIFEVEWTAMLGESVLRRGSRAGGLQRFLVVAPERAELLQLKIERNAALRRRLAEDTWLFVRFDALSELAKREILTEEDLAHSTGLQRLAPPEGVQLALF